MEHSIDSVQKSEYEAVVTVWEAAVRATHHFLKEEDIAYFRPLILSTYLDAVDLLCVRNEAGEIVGFSGVADHGLEMLFIHPDYRGRKLGKILLDHAIAVQKITKVDVNEQNEQAVGFYLHCNFRVTGRSELDPTGKPYPILHMELIK